MNSDFAGDPSKQLQKLLRGVSSNHIKTVRDSWRNLLSEGRGSVGCVCDALRSTSWSETPKGPSAKYLGVLLALLHELDPIAFAEEIKALQHGKLHILHKRTVDLISKRIVESPSIILDDDIPVYVASDISDPEKVTAALSRWVRTKGVSLKDLTRIDVISEQPELDYLGKYDLMFSGVILVWPTLNGKRIDNFVRLLYAESSFYHEIGHHVLGHDEGGQVEEQEKEANAYARSQLRRSHPVLAVVGDIVKLPARIAYAISSFRRR